MSTNILWLTTVDHIIHLLVTSRCSLQKCISILWLSTTPSSSMEPGYSRFWSRSHQAASWSRSWCSQSLGCMYGELRSMLIFFLVRTCCDGRWLSATESAIYGLAGKDRNREIPPKTTEKTDDCSCYVCIHSHIFVAAVVLAYTSQIHWCASLNHILWQKKMLKKFWQPVRINGSSLSTHTCTALSKVLPTTT